MTQALGPHKIEMIYKSLTWGLDVIITDSDAFILRDPFPFMARWPDAGFLTTSDHLGNTTGGQGLESHGGIHTAFNIGYMFFRSSSLPLVEEWRRVILEQPEERWDQACTSASCHALMCMCMCMCMCVSVCVCTSASCHALMCKCASVSVSVCVCV